MESQLASSKVARHGESGREENERDIGYRISRPSLSLAGGKDHQSDIGCVSG